MKMWAWAGVLLLAAAAFGQEAQPPKAADLSGLSRADLETLCHNLYARVDELHQELTGAQERSERLRSENADLKRQVDDLMEKAAALEKQSDAGAGAAPAPGSGAGGDDASSQESIHDRLKRLSDFGEQERLKMIAQYRDMLQKGQAAQAGEADRLNAELGVLEQAQGRFIPSLGADGMFAGPLIMGAMGQMSRFHIVKVVDDNNMVVQVLSANGALGWVEGIPTSGLVDGQMHSSDTVVEVKMTKRFHTSRGYKTILRITPMGVDQWVEREPRTSIMLIKTNHP